MILPNKPFRVEFEIINKCNLNCIYCYAKPFDSFTPNIKKLEYLFEKTKIEVNPFEVVLIGGEPFMRKDAVTVFELAHKIFDMSIGISTNATLLNKLSARDLNIMHYLSTNNAISLQVSIDSINYKINNSTRGLTHLSTSGIDLLEKNNIKFGIGIVMTSINKLDIQDTIKNLMLTYKNLNSINLEPLQPSLQMDQDKYVKLKLSYNDTYEIYNEVIGIAKEIRRNDINITKLSECQTAQTLLDSYGFKTCNAGLLRSGVLANGDVVPCVILRNIILGNLHKDSWDVIWNKSKERFITLNNSGIQTTVGQCNLVNILRREERSTINSAFRTKITSS